MKAAALPQKYNTAIAITQPYLGAHLVSIVEYIEEAQIKKTRI